MSPSTSPNDQQSRESVSAADWLRHLFLNNWFRVPFFVVVIAIVFLIVLTIILLFTSPNQAIFLTLITSIFIQFVFIAFLSLLYRSVSRELKLILRQINAQRSDLGLQRDRLKQELSEQLKGAHELVSNYRDEVFAHFAQAVTMNLAFEIGPDEIKRLEGICLFTLSRVRRSFQQYFKSRDIDVGEDISLSVKLVIPTSKILEFFPRIREEDKEQIHRRDQWIVTILRDPYTIAEHSGREMRAALYDIGGNTAFHHIIENRQPFFLENNLTGMGNNYINKNPNWEEQYNSTLVAPISYQDIASGQPVCFGLLAVDSLNKAKRSDLFNDQECLHILSHSADLLATFFLLLALLRYRE